LHVTRPMPLRNPLEKSRLEPHADPRMLTRRKLLTWLGASALLPLLGGGYAVGIEPMRMGVTRYRLSLPNWPGGLKLRIAVLADLHACRPWMNAGRIADIVDQTNSLAPDITLLLGDYAASHRFKTGNLPLDTWATALGALKAPLGIHAVLGNHDWWDDAEAQARGRGPVAGGQALQRAGIRVYENYALRIEKDGHAFWLAGLGDQIALLPRNRWSWRSANGVDDLPATLAKITDDAPVILMAHEPDIFPRVPDRVALTLSGHTHGGQVRLFGYAPFVPSRYGNRYAYGHLIETRDAPGAMPRHLVVSGGLGCSIAPIRFAMPPEIVLIELG
jgi:uncharacterized protein